VTGNSAPSYSGSGVRNPSAGAILLLSSRSGGWAAGAAIPAAIKAAPRGPPMETMLPAGSVLGG